MLDKNDLQSIKEIIDGRLDKNLKPIKDDVQLIRKEIKPIKSMQKDIKKIRKTTDMMGKLFDKADVKLHKRVQRVEDILHI